MRIVKNKFKGLLIIKDKIYKDKRGYLKELYNQKKIKKKLSFEFVSCSKKNVLRGLHFQIKKPQAKFISVLKGKLLDICLDLRKNSATFGKYFKIILDSKTNISIYIPEGFAHGFLSLTKETIMLYNCNEKRYAKYERAITWNDTDINIKWPKNTKYIISNKDQKNLSFKNFKKINPF